MTCIRQWPSATWAAILRKFMQSGEPPCAISASPSDEKWNDKRSGVQKESTTWYRVAVWKSASRLACNKYVRKGSKVLVVR